MSSTRTAGTSAALLSASQLRKRYIVALSLIALLTVVSQFVVQLLISDQAHDSRIVNIAGRQRMLSQKIAKLSLYIVKAESSAAASGFRTQLDESLSLWQRSHRGLLQGDSTMELPGRNSKEVVALFAAIDLNHRAMVAAVQNLLAAPANGTNLDREMTLIREHEPLFLAGMNDIVFLYDLEAKQRIASARSLEVSLMTVTLVVLMLEAVFIFSPAARRIQSSMQALADHEADLEQLFAASPSAMLLVDGKDLSILNANQKATDLLGLPAPRTTSLRLHHYLQQDDDGNHRFLGNAGRKELIDEHELAMRDAQGALLNVLVSVRRMYFSGRQVLVLGMTDITERKRVEAELSISAIAFESQEGMFITDAAKKILRVNQAFTDITGYSAAEVLGRTPSVISSGRHDSSFYAAMYESIEHSGTWQGEIWNRRKNGDSFPEWLTITAVKDGQGKLTHYVSTLADITLRKAAEDEIHHLAFYDPLTHLPNRRLLIDRLQQAMASSSRSRRAGALLFIDLDHFKTLNDTLGHDKGDLLLQQVAARLSGCVRDEDTVARFGGDEFVVMLEDLSVCSSEAATQTEAVGEKILAVLNQPYDLSGSAYRSTPSIGVALFAGHQDSIEDLMKRADLAMYEAKTAGRNTLRFFDPQMQAVVTARALLENGLREALRARQFRLYYQPQVDAAGSITGAEALVRWQHPERGLILPAEFIPAAEESGLILPLGLWVLETACAQLADWANQARTAQLSMAVNVSARQFRHPDFVAQVLEILERSGANAHRLMLELTESLVLTNVDDIISTMTKLKAVGVGFSLDDFGTGYSSLSCLKLLPLDELKIDRSFVRDILTDPNDAVIARTIVTLARSLGLSVVAEGVETTGQLETLVENGCHSFQGYLFSRPVPRDEFELLLMAVGSAKISSLTCA